jgi:hypothetical protein
MGATWYCFLAFLHQLLTTPSSATSNRSNSHSLVQLNRKEVEPSSSTTLPIPIQSFETIDRPSNQLIAIITCKHRPTLLRSDQIRPKPISSNTHTNHLPLPEKSNHIPSNPTQTLQPIQPTNPQPPPIPTMCKFYAHTHPCGHTKTVFAAFCPSAALVQRPCSGGKIWATVKMEMDCAACGSSDNGGNGDEYRGVAMVGGRRFSGGAAAAAAAAAAVGGQRGVGKKGRRRG